MIEGVAVCLGDGIEERGILLVIHFAVGDTEGAVDRSERARAKMIGVWRIVRVIHAYPSKLARRWLLDGEILRIGELPEFLGISWWTIEEMPFGKLE